MSETVVITGIGATTPLGGNVDDTWSGLLAGKSGVSTIEEEWAADLPTQIAAQCAVEPDLPRVEARRMDRVSQLAVVAALQAWSDAGYGLGEDNNVDPERLGISCGTGIGGLHSLLGNWDTQKERGLRRVSPYTIPLLMANAAASNIGLRVGAMAGLHTPVSACASSNEAIAQALDTLRLDRADVVIAGGSEAVVHPFTLAGFSQMKALSRRNDEPERASRPWDTGRDGFILGEGSVMFVLETLSHAKARGATILGTLAGAGLSADSHDMVQPDPSGRGQMLAMRRALADAGVEPNQVSHVNAHATATPQGDTTEAKSICGVLGEDPQAVVTGTKSMTGHLLGAAGAIESLATVLALRDREVPPTINLDDMEPDLGIDIAANKSRELPAGDLAAINNSFGFGGPNVALCFTNEHVTA